MINWIIYFLKWIAWKLRNRFYFDQWQILYNFSKSNFLSYDINKFQKIVPPKDRFWADPFIVKFDDMYYLFFEELIYKENKGTISCIKLLKDGSHSTPIEVLNKEFHLSYPFIFKFQNKLYMIPETLENKAIDLYECKKFPEKWNFKFTLLNNIQAVDSTILFHDNLFWLFCNIKSNKTKTTWDELHLFYTNDFLNNEFQSHPMNPIVSSRKYSRPAGNIFMDNGRLIRPAQNCTKHYGYGIEFREIIKLSQTDYLEKKAKSIYPDNFKGINSIHTYNQLESISVFDAKIKRRKFF